MENFNRASAFKRQRRDKNSSNLSIRLRREKTAVTEKTAATKSYISEDNTEPVESSSKAFEKKYLNPNDVCFRNSSLNEVFPKPLRASINKIYFVVQYEKTLYLKASLTQEAKDYLATLKKEDQAVTKTTPQALNRDQIRVDITLSPEGKGRFHISHPRFEWWIDYYDVISEIVISTFDFSILSSEQQIANEIKRGKLCPYCHAETRVVSDKEIYGSSYGKTFIQCTANPDHYVGTYANGKSLGRLADKTLRLKKREAHAAFDPLWNENPKLFKTRNGAYKWLSKQMGIPFEDTHFGMFDEAQCLQAIQLIERYKRRKKIQQKLAQWFKLK